MELALSNTELMPGAAFTAAQKAGMASGSTCSAASATPSPSPARRLRVSRFM
jgi:hypothetical protein